MSENKDDIYKYQPLWGKWYIELPIGKGSYGSVYKVTREEMGNQYDAAVKIITIPSEEQNKEARASFGNDEETLNGYFKDIVSTIVNEINVLYSLGGNSNIISYQDHEVVKRSDSVGWDILIRMEYVTSLTKYVQNNRMSREQVVKMGIDICTALELCSKKGLVHRDIKNENIFINKDGVFKLGDFGIARELSKSGRAASMRGTPLYMAPEVFKGEKYDAAVDIYSLGIVMYKLLNCSRIPFMPEYPEPIKYSDSEEALERRISGQQLPMPNRAGNKLGNAVVKACAYKAEDRFESAEAMKSELESILSEMSKKERQELVTPEFKTSTEKANKQENQTETVGMHGFNGTGAMSDNNARSQTMGIFGTVATGRDLTEKTAYNQETEIQEKGKGLRITAIVLAVLMLAATMVDLLYYSFSGAEASWIWLSLIIVVLACIGAVGALLIRNKPRLGIALFATMAAVIILVYGGGIYVI